MLSKQWGTELEATRATSLPYSTRRPRLPFWLPRASHRELDRPADGPPEASRPEVGSPLCGGMEEMQECGAVLASVEAHAEAGEVVPSQGRLDGLQGTCHLFPQRRPCEQTDEKPPARCTWPAGGGGEGREQAALLQVSVAPQSGSGTVRTPRPRSPTSVSALYGSPFPSVP